MSIWTHVAGVIRFDSFLGEDLDLGIPVDFRDSLEDFCKCTLPCGSEGSLEYQIYENPDPHSVARWSVQFWGDLRDYDNEEEIINLDIYELASIWYNTLEEKVKL